MSVDAASFSGAGAVPDPTSVLNRTVRYTLVLQYFRDRMFCHSFHVITSHLSSPASDLVLEASWNSNATSPALLRQDVTVLLDSFR